MKKITYFARGIMMREQFPQIPDLSTTAWHSLWNQLAFKPVPQRRIKYSQFIFRVFPFAFFLLRYPLH